MAANRHFPATEITEAMDVDVGGRVHVVRSLHR